MKKAKIGLVCLVRKTFDFETAFKLYNERIKEVMKDETVEWFNYPSMVIDPVDAKNASDFFLTNKVDAIVVVSATFHL